MTTHPPLTGKRRFSVVPTHPSHVHKPTHAHCFPQRESESEPVDAEIARPDEPTSTPDLLLRPLDPEEAVDNEEPPARTEAIEPQSEDWLDTDAAR